MRNLLLDEMLAPAVAEQLLAVGIDAVAISADASLRGMPDPEVLELAARQSRVLVTDNIQDFAPLAASWSAQGRTHGGLLFVSSKSFPQTRGRMTGIAAALRLRQKACRWPAAGESDFLT